MNTEQLIDKLTKAISFKFATDKTAPGLTVAALKKGYYCSVVRYQGAFAKDKVVVCKAKNETLDGALKDIAKQFLIVNKPTPNPIQELNALLQETLSGK